VRCCWLFYARGIPSLTVYVAVRFFFIYSCFIVMFERIYWERSHPYTMWYVCGSNFMSSFLAVYQTFYNCNIARLWTRLESYLIVLSSIRYEALCVSVCLLITREWVGWLPPNFQGSSTVPRRWFMAQNRPIVSFGQLPPVPCRLNFFETIKCNEKLCKKKKYRRKSRTNLLLCACVPPPML